MGYDIPDEIKYKEKIVANLDMKQLGYLILFGLLAFFSYKLPIQNPFNFVLPSLTGIIGIGFVFLGLEEKIKDILSYYINIRKAPSNSKSAQKFFQIKKIENDSVYLDNSNLLAIISIEPINFALLDGARKKALLENYKIFLNHLSTSIQILIRTSAIDMENYFEKIDIMRRPDLTNIFLDFQSFVQKFITEQKVRKRFFYLIVPIANKKDNLKELEDNVKIIQEKLDACGLQNKRLKNDQIRNFYLYYASVSDNSDKKEIKVKKEEQSTDLFRSILTPSFEITSDYALVKNEFHKIIKIIGYPRKVEDGWLQTFLSKNEDYDISIHINPSTISWMLTYLHNQIVQQTSDLFMSTAKGTPNPSLEIKKADTLRVYNELYKGEEKLFQISLYIDNKATDLKQLEFLTGKCKANLNSMLMVPSLVKWRIADGIKSTMPLASDKLDLNRQFLTSSLKATFPFISPTNSITDGTLFAFETQTMNPIFVDFDAMSNKHFFLIGISGSGKSYTTKYLMMQNLFKSDVKVYILDPNGEYKGICNKLGGQIIELSKDSKSTLNIFDMGNQDFGSKMLSLISFFDIIAGGLTESQKAVLNKALPRAYSLKGITKDDPKQITAPTFSDIKNVLEKMQAESGGELQDKSIETLISRVSLYSKGGFFDFLDAQGNIDSSNNIVCFDLSKLPNAVRTLLMFGVLDYIANEIKKDTKPKLAIIDEGWSLLKSNEASNYILDFIKTSRKFNTSIGFVTQEIEDLINNATGRSILNTASTKILMRQNPSNLNLISKNLNLNELEESYLLSAPKGNGLLITEANRYKFFIAVPDSLHLLITTNPNENKIIEKKMIDKKIKVSLDLGKGFYIKNDLTNQERQFLIENGYKQHEDRLTQAGAMVEYLVLKKGNESLKHAFLCWITAGELKKYFKDVETFATVGPDVVVKTSKGNICFEIELGTLLERVATNEIQARFAELERTYYKFFIVVPDKELARQYENFGPVITKLEITRSIEQVDKEINILGEGKVKSRKK